MSLFQLAILAIVQGVTEFLPVSSSGHLILLPKLLGSVDQGLALDVAVHVGTLGAVIMYFRADVVRIWHGCIDIMRGKLKTDNARLAFLLAIATVPVVVIGLILKVTGTTELLRSMKVIGWTMLVFGVVLYWADKKGPTVKTEGDWNLRDAIIFGLWQAVALLPGTSRSGITITASRFLGYDRTDGAKIAMLMSIPTIIASGVLLGADVVSEANWQTARDGAIGAVLAFIAAFLALSLMMRLLRSVSYTPYVIYRVILGVIILGIAYTA
ncbi:undecaprenyl-diphosphate phosphatase [Amaricoccus tamworthensis]|uniref:undecaprenyl-diphosphate phosphatase n=1 Tax=Amaricoccus tamworthensis TaxID=57002 RepID=UPI003C7B8EBE